MRRLTRFAVACLVLLPAEQTAAQCTFSTSPAHYDVSRDGGDFSVTLNTQPGCDWTARAQGSLPHYGQYAHLIDQNGQLAFALSGSGPATLTYRVRRNELTQALTGGLSIGNDLLHTFRQAAGGLILTLSVEGGAGGFIRTVPAATAFAPPSIDCATSCTQDVPRAQVITLFPVSHLGFVFGGWLGDPDCLNSEVVLTGDRSCTARFLPDRGTPPPPGVVDLNGDGAGDAFLYNPATGTWWMEYGNRTGSFGSLQWFWLPGWSVQPADFNADGLTDFFLTRTTEWAGGSKTDWTRLTNRNTGADMASFSSEWSSGWRIQFLDLNADGRSDAFLYNPATGLWFQALTTGGEDFFYYPRGSWSQGWQTYPVDLNGDRFDDLFLYNPVTGQWFWAINDRAGNFTYRTERWSPGWEIHPGDFNADGRSDLFLYNPQNGLWFVCLNTGASFTYVAGRWDAGWGIHVADLDANSIADLFLYNGATGQWFEVLNDGVGNFRYFNGFWSPGWEVQVTDLNRDRRADILLYSGLTGQWFQALNLSIGTFSYSTGTWSPSLDVIASRDATP